MRRIIDNPTMIPSLQPAIHAAKELGCTIGKGFTMGNTRVGLHFTGPDGKTAFFVEFHQRNWQAGGEKVQLEAAKYGILPTQANRAIPHLQPLQPQP